MEQRGGGRKEGGDDILLFASGAEMRTIKLNKSKGDYYKVEYSVCTRKTNRGWYSIGVKHRLVTHGFVAKTPRTSIPYWCYGVLYST